MASINIDPGLQEWLEQAVFRLFEERGITVTQAAKNIIAYTVQAQEEDAPPHLREEFARLQQNMTARATARGTFFEGSAAVFLQLYPANAVLNVNRAVRLMTEMYLQRFGSGFPCGPTRGGRSGSGSQSGGRKPALSGFQEPAGVGV